MWRKSKYTSVAPPLLAKFRAIVNLTMDFNCLISPMRIYTYSFIMLPRMPCLKMMQTKQAGNSQNPAASEDANEDVSDETPGENNALAGFADGQGHLRNHIERCFGQSINDNLQ